MFESLGRLMFRRRLVLAAAGRSRWRRRCGARACSGRWARGFEDPGSDLARPPSRPRGCSAGTRADVVVLYSSPALTVDDAAFRTAVNHTLSALPARYVANTPSYWGTGAPQLVSAERHATYAVLELAGACHM